MASRLAQVRVFSTAKNPVVTKDKIGRESYKIKGGDEIHFRHDWKERT